jgi:hypothetical protein
MNRYYCYIDESGQHTMGKIFVVSIVVPFDREKLEKTLLNIEKVTRKNKVKWIKTQKDRKLLYLGQVFKLINLRGNIYFSMFENSKEYKALTVLSLVKAVKDKKYIDKKATILIDGLNKHEVMWFSKEIRKQGLKTDKVRGLKDENSAIIRLADSICGFVFEAKTGNNKAGKLLSRELKKKTIKEV